MKINHKPKQPKLNWRNRLQQRILHLHFSYLIWCGYYNERFEPLRCTSCDSWHMTDHEQIVTDSIDWYPCEYYVRCKLCGNNMGHWAYGHFEPWKF